MKKVLEMNYSQIATRRRHLLAYIYFLDHVMYAVSFANSFNFVDSFWNLIVIYMLCKI